MLQSVRPSCETCQFFQRFTEEQIGDAVTATVSPTDETEADPSLLIEFGKCIRNPPQFFYETLNGEWPVVHETKLCGEYRVTTHHLHN
jgi:hypothetical protein